MNRYDAEHLYELLPAQHRWRDAQLGYPLRDLVTVLAGQAQVVEQDILRLYENLFVETADPWVVDYIGDLIGVIPLSDTGAPPRAEVANTIGYRRRKGTAGVLEEIARTVTGWTARMQEFFQLLATTQYMNHVRAGKGGTAEVRDADALARVDGPFDTAAHTADVRRIVTRRGRHNIRNVGLYVWPIKALQLRLVEPHAVEPDKARYTFDVLGRDLPLYHLPASETGTDSIAEEQHVATPIRRRSLYADARLDSGDRSYFGASIALLKPVGDGWESFGEDKLVACDLTVWDRALKPGAIAVDPEVGRLVFASPDDRPDVFRVHYHHGFSAELGGGQYGRKHLLDADMPFLRVGDTTDPTVRKAYVEVEGEHPDVVPDLEQALHDATQDWTEDETRIIEMADSRTYGDPLSEITVPSGRNLIVRAAAGQRPALILGEPWRISGEVDSGFELDGLLIAGHPVELAGSLNRVTLRHLTLLPDGSGLHVQSGAAEVAIDHAILGRIRADEDATITVTDSIIDALDAGLAAFAGPDGTGYGGTLELNRVTVIGTVATTELHAENSILFGTVTSERRQQGCVRYSWIEPGSRVPRRYKCQPDIPSGTADDQAARLRNRLAPRFVSLRYGQPAYCRLDRSCDDAVRRGDEDRSEMGAFSSLREPQREDNLITRLDEYLPVGLEAGVFHQVFQRSAL